MPGERSFARLFPPFAEKMAGAGVPRPAAEAFRRHFRRLVAGEMGIMPESALEPVQELRDAESLDPKLASLGAEAAGSTVVIRLNGGLGTSMGLESPKSLLVVKNGLTFLDLICRQSEAAGCPLLLMNSFATEPETRAALARLSAGDPAEPEGPGRIRTFLQHRVPRIQAHDLAPAGYAPQPDLEWCPPGHGDLYHALHSSGLLDRLLAEGKRYALVANVDNLGADLDLTILGFFVQRRLPFLMEVTDRTAADAKGGHLAWLRGPDRRLVLRESAQCAEEDQEFFQDIRRHRYFNTNNLWIDLVFLHRQLSQAGLLELPLICNRKPLLPWDPDSLPVYQLESAMGAAISLFPGAQAIRVPRRRFAPVKTTSDLLVIRSDATVLSPEGHVLPNPRRTLPEPPVVWLDPQFYRTTSDLDERFPAGPPSLAACRSLRVEGDVRFAVAPECIGDVRVVNRSSGQAVVTARRLEGEVRL
ncbi:MAG: UTP--glucose-1-phosphate uridylyltransferase [Acidobacteriota bacterium]